MKRIITAILAISLFGFAAWLFWQERERQSSEPAMQMSAPLESPPYTGKLKYLALGDSYTIGQSVAPADRWPMQLAKKLRATGIDLSDPVIIARTGWTTGDLLNAINRTNLNSDFDLVTLMIGVNNQFQGRGEEEYRKQFDELLNVAITFARSHSNHVIVLSIPDWTMTPFGAQYDSKRMSAEVDRFNTIRREETLKRGAEYVDVTPVSRAAATQLSGIADDGLHPSSKQYERWTALVAKQARILPSSP